MHSWEGEMQYGDSQSENQIALYPTAHKKPYLQAK